jgi:serine/threonine-protein kinase
MKYCPVCKAKYEDSVSFCAIDGEVLEEDSTTLVGATLDGQYHIEALLGKGGMGAVYRARHILLGDRVAIKVLPPEMRNNAEWLRRFRREGQAARRFRHPNAVTVYDLRTTSEGLIYMVMEYVEGHTLDAEMKAQGGRLTPVNALRIMEPVMSVLNAAHAMGVVHRDLKPENIMLGKPGEDGQPVTKLLDLGIAKMREVAGADAAGTTALTMAGQVLGTPFYMSPEQWGEVPQDGNMEIDGRADIYSLGCVFYELIVGRRAFGGLTLQELRREHVSVNARPLHEFQQDVTEAFSRAIARAMSKDRNERQATAGELANELRVALGESPLSTSQMSYNASSTNVQSGASNTAVGNPEFRHTNAEVINPTMMTVDSPPRPQANQPAQPPATSMSQPPPLNATSLAQSAPNVNPYNAPNNAPSYNPGYQASPQPPPTAYSQANAYNPAQSSTPQPSYSLPASAPAPARSKSVPIIAAVMGVVLLAAVVGGFFLWRNMSAKTDEAKTDGGGTQAHDTQGTNKNNDSTTGGTTTGTREAMTYWLEVQAAAGGGQSARVAGVVPLASGQSFKLHFTPRENGYLYIIAPGEKNVPTTFLTAKPIPVSGVKSNALKASVDFSFPGGAENWIKLDETSGTENYTVIFSPTQLSSPAFLSASAAHPLSSAEQKELEDFRAQFNANAPATNVINGSGVDPFVSIKIPQAKPSGEPVIFDVRIEHK